MSSPNSPYEFEYPIEHKRATTYEATLDVFVTDVIRGVEEDMRSKPAPMVYEMLSMQLGKRLPGAEVSDEVLREAAARIAAGLPVT